MSNRRASLRSWLRMLPVVVLVVLVVGSLTAATNADTTPPQTTINSQPPLISNGASASFTFFGSDDVTPPGSLTFECELDGGGFSSCTSPKNYGFDPDPPLSSGSHTFKVRATDGASNTDASPAEFTWTIDLPPVVTINSGPANPTTSTSASFTFSGTDDNSAPANITFQCALDAAAYSACTSPLNYAGPLAGGPHGLQVRGTDEAGNTSLIAVYNWTIDLNAPNTIIDSGPSGSTAQTTALFTFSSTEAGSTFECQLDGGGYSSCTSPANYPGLAVGSHTFDVRATDPSGNVDASPASRSWTIVQSSDTTITSGPSGLVNSRSARFTFTASPAGGTFHCRLDYFAHPAIAPRDRIAVPGEGHWILCRSPKTYSGLADGPHTVEVRARNAAGVLDPTPDSRSWTVDATKPNTTITSGPGATTNDNTPTFTFTSTEAGTFQCAVGLAWQSCSSPFTTGALTLGAKTFRVRAIDTAGNVDPTPATYAFKVIATAMPRQL